MECRLQFVDVVCSAAVAVVMHRRFLVYFVVVRVAADSRFDQEVKRVLLFTSCGK